MPDLVVVNVQFVVQKKICPSIDGCENLLPVETDQNGCEGCRKCDSVGPKDPVELGQSK